MKTVRKLSLFGISGIVICTLIFIGISSLHANSIGKKPVKPPEANWAVQFPEKSGMLHGDGLGSYSGQDENIEVKVELNEPLPIVWTKNSLV